VGVHCIAKKSKSKAGKKTSSALLKKAGKGGALIHVTTKKAALKIARGGYLKRMKTRGATIICP
jgi:hypothetical protein